MVLDTSAILAVLFAESDSERFERAVASSITTRVSAGTLLETAIVVEARLGEPGERELDELIRRWGVVIESVDATQLDHGRDAFRRYGKGRHPASLNYGDCFAYALAIAMGERLLFKGDDFARTDVLNALDHDADDSDDDQSSA